MGVCESCFEKQREIDRQGEEIVRLRAKLRYQDMETKEGYFGSGTPSSKIPIKENSENSGNNGGLREGHKGYGRKLVTEKEADPDIDPYTLLPLP